LAGCTAILFGMAGIGQYLLLRAITGRITGLCRGSILPFLLGKLLLYGVLSLLVMTLLRPFALWAGIGYGVGMIAAVGVGTLRSITKGNKSTERK